MKEQLKRIAGEHERMRQALLRIAFSEDVSGLAGDPWKWPSTIAYEAIGGEFVEGQRVHTRRDFEPHPETKPGDG